MSQRATVAIVRCADYSPEAVLGAVRRGVGLLGGAARFARAGERLLLKPNMLAPDPPERGVTTHPSVLRAVGEVFLQAGARVSFGDSPALRKQELTARRTGLLEAAQAAGIPMVDFSSGRTVSNPEGAQNKQFRVAEAALDADGLVNLPKLKTHGLTRLTGAVKNLFGAVPGMLKAEFHVRLPDPDAFARMLVDLAALLRARLHVMDAVEAMEGNGPRSGTLKHVGLLLFSTDPVALDATASRIVGLTPEYVPTTRFGEQTGLGVAQADRIELVGEPLAAVRVERFDVVNTPPRPLPQRGLMRLVRDRVVPRPVIVKVRCTRCGECVAVCPTEPKSVDWLIARDARPDRTWPPRHRYATCIRCYCCQEVCPERAIVIKTPWLGKLLPR
jgi:uncharacterized protein (DUF362 family)/Pyruvate/2-oxoacid:ferredoxin oxidoreductase delta subunit